MRDLLEKFAPGAASLGAAARAWSEQGEKPARVEPYDGATFSDDGDEDPGTDLEVAGEPPRKYAAPAEARFEPGGASESGGRETAAARRLEDGGDGRRRSTRQRGGIDDGAAAAPASHGEPLGVSRGRRRGRK